MRRARGAKGVACSSSASKVVTSPSRDARTAATGRRSQAIASACSWSSSSVCGIQPK